MADLPVVISAAGVVPQTPAALREELLALVAADRPGYTANLPGSLVEDISSTDVYAITQCDAAFVELLNSISPRTANPWLLIQLGDLYGVVRGAVSNTSVFCVFSGPPGFVIAKGFTVTDGTYQYIAQDGAIIGADGSSQPVYCLAATPGIWSVPVGTVNALVTSVPDGFDVTVINQQPGTPGTGTESEESYRARVLIAGKAAAQGMTSLLKTLLTNIPGVQSRLVSVVQLPNNGGWQVLCAGGDQYEVAYAIFTALFDINQVFGSVIAVEGITQANPGVVTTDINHNLSTGDHATLADVVGMIQVNGQTYTITVIDPKTFSIGTNTSGFGAYVSGGVVTPNERNITVTITDYPDTYSITYVNPPPQEVVINVTWNTISANIVSAASVAQLAAAALTDYINGIVVGQPINLFELQRTFQNAVASIIPTALLTRMEFAVSIDGVSVPPEAGTGVIAGDPVSYLFTEAANILVTQG